MVRSSFLSILVLVVGCGDGRTGRLDSGPGIDSGSRDSGSSVDSGPPIDARVECSPGVQCTGYAGVLEAAPRGATDITNCVIQLHRLDCCGAMAAYGVNHAARADLCPAEAACLAQYPTPASCSDNTITTDNGDTTTDPNQVRVQIVDPVTCSFGTCYTCQTFVCRETTSGSCFDTLPGISPNQCG